MRKVFATLFILVILFSAFAGEYSQCFESKVNDLRFVPVTSMNSSDLSYLFFEDPSGLSVGKNRFSFPTIAIQASHVASLLSQLSNEDTISAIETVINGDEIDYKKLIDAGYKFLDNYPDGITDLFKVDLSTGFQKDYFAMSLNVEAALASETVGGGASIGNIISLKLMPRVNSALSIGYGRTIFKNEVFTINAGIALHGIQQLVTEKIDIPKGAEIVALETKDLKSILEAIKSDAGLSVTSDMKIEIQLTDKPFSFDFAIHNLPGLYKVKCYDSISDMINYESNGTKYSVQTPTTISSYFTLDFIPLNFWDGRIKLYARAGIDGFGAEDSDIKELFDAKICLNLFDVAECVIRNKAGYYQYGLSLNVFENRLEVLYGWHEEGSYLGDKPVDSLTLKMTLGYGKKK